MMLVLRYAWYRLLKPRLILEPHHLARDVLVAVLVAASRPRGGRRGRAVR